MESNASEQQERRDAPRSGAPAPFLDKGDRNLPRDGIRPVWRKKQWTTRRAVLDRLRYWQSDGYQCLWVTLTSSPSSPAERLRADFQALRKRVGRELGFWTMEYVCVDTREGHGVLHMIWAWKDRVQNKRGSFYVPFEWLQASWKSIHGAFHVNVKRIGGEDQDARRLSRYIVAQYCGDQNALVRLSQSRAAVPLTKMRARLLRAVKDLPERFEAGQVLSRALHGEEFSRAFNQLLWKSFHESWSDLVRYRSCDVFGVKLVWIDGELRRL